ncbi:MAG: 3-dehydroquinate synthase [Cyclobacteriaceae bacterium]
MLASNVTIVSDIKSALADFFSTHKFSGVFLLVDENTEAHCLPLIQDVLPEFWLVKIQSGEEQKHIETCTQIWRSMTEAKLDRKALMINLGGGVIGDMGGFCAGTYKRGISFINVPTTLLSQVDASVGGKLGIDFDGFKNHIGLFRDPDHVFISPEFLATLSHRELRSGFAEVVKHAYIRDSTYLESLKSATLADQPWMERIQHSIGIKSEVVAEDPTEQHLRKILNFGHTVGHAIETSYLETDKKLLHGEAIAVGMICELYLSHKLLELDKDEVAQESKYLAQLFESKAIERSDFEMIVNNALQDKKNEGGVVKMSLLRALGDCTYDIPVSGADMLDSLFYFNTVVKN